jgi:hypothetical protein
MKLMRPHLAPFSYFPVYQIIDPITIRTHQLSKSIEFATSATDPSFNNYKSLSRHQTLAG